MHESPYLFHVFLTPRIFALEFIRQRIISKTEHYLKLHRDFKLKFPLVLHSYREEGMIHTSSYTKEDR
jgi:hypothetical protein